MSRSQARRRKIFSLVVEQSPETDDGKTKTSVQGVPASLHGRGNVELLVCGLSLNVQQNYV